MKKGLVFVATENRVKIDAVEHAFQKVSFDKDWDIKSVAVPSGVSSQPFSEEETLKGAMNRAENAKKKRPNADYWIGIESGLVNLEYEIGYFAWCVVMSEYLCGKGRSGMFFLPEKISKLVRAGKTLSDADQIVFKRDTASEVNGMVGLLTGGTITRTEFYIQPLLFALVPFINEELYL